MKRALLFDMGVAIVLLLFAGVTPVVDKIQVKFWNTKWYARAVLPDTSTAELNSATDLTYTQWQALFEKHWLAMQEPPDLKVLYDCPTYTIRDPNDGNLVLEWKPDNLRLTVTKLNVAILRESTTRMNDLFTKGIP